MQWHIKGRRCRMSCIKYCLVYFSDRYFWSIALISLTFDLLTHPAMGAFLKNRLRFLHLTVICSVGIWGGSNRSTFLLPYISFPSKVSRQFANHTSHHHGCSQCVQYSSACASFASLSVYAASTLSTLSSRRYSWTFPTAEIVCSSYRLSGSSRICRWGCTVQTQGSSSLLLSQSITQYLRPSFLVRFSSPSFSHSVINARALSFPSFSYSILLSIFHPFSRSALSHSSYGPSLSLLSHSFTQLNSADY